MMDDGVSRLMGFLRAKKSGGLSRSLMDTRAKVVAEPQPSIARNLGHVSYVPNGSTPVLNLYVN